MRDEAVLREVAEVWGLTVEGRLSRDDESIVVAVRRVDGARAALKLATPGEEFTAQARVMAESRTCVRVLDVDEDRGALLMERLGESLDGSGTATMQLGTMATLLQGVWEVPVGLGAHLPEPKSVVLRRILDELGPTVGEGWPRGIRLARSWCGGLARGEAQEVVCHGDPHPRNCLRRIDGFGWAWIDPDGLVGERAYDLGVLLRDWGEEFRVAEATEPDSGREMLVAMCDSLAASSGLAWNRIWAWGYIERVTTGLVLRHRGRLAEGAAWLDIAEKLATVT